MSWRSRLLVIIATLLAAGLVSSVCAQERCVVTQYSQLNGARECSQITIRALKVPVGGSIDLKLRSGTTVIFEGTTSFAPSSRPGRTTPLVSISGTNIRIIGAPGNQLNGNGQAYWDGVGSNSGRTIDKPKFFRLQLTSSRIEGLNILNAPVHMFSINNCRSLVLDRIRIDNSAGDASSAGGNGKKLGHNTDAFDVGDSSDITISNAHVHNQDDCLAINSGDNIRFLNGTCIGGHGLSIGSVGGRSNNAVRNVVISDSRIVRSENGIRIKTKAGRGRGEVTNVTYSNIRMEGITKRGIVIQQDYENSGPTGRPGGDVHIGGVRIVNVSGSVGAGAKKVYVLCAQGGCTDWNWSNVNVSGGSGSSCRGQPGGVSNYCR